MQKAVTSVRLSWDVEFKKSRTLLLVPLNNSIKFQPTLKLWSRVLSQVSSLDPLERACVVVELVEQVARVEKLIGNAHSQVGVVGVEVVGDAPHHLDVVRKVLGRSLHLVGHHPTDTSEARLKICGSRIKKLE